MALAVQYMQDELRKKHAESIGVDAWFEQRVLERPAILKEPLSRSIKDSSVVPLKKYVGFRV